MTRELLRLAPGVLPRWIPHGLPGRRQGHVVNAIEWNFAVLMAAYYLLTWRAARASRPAG